MDACNFDVNATDDDGLCDWSCYGCTDADATNFNSAATSEDGSCFYSDDATDGNPCPADLDSDGIVGTPDLLTLLSSFGLSCE